MDFDENKNNTNEDNVSENQDDLYVNQIPDVPDVNTDKFDVDDFVYDVNKEQSNQTNYEYNAADQGQYSQYNNMNQQQIADISSYKQNIKNMKKEMRRLKREEKARSRDGIPEIENIPDNAVVYKKGVDGFSLITVMVVCILIGCALSIAAISFLPNAENSILGQMVKRYSTNKTNNIYQGNPGGEITITGETDSVAKAVYAKAAQSVVGIRVISKSSQFWENVETTKSEGSGVIYSADGLVITNHHVVSEAVKDGKIQSNYEIRVFLDATLQNYIKAELVGYDSDTDLAVLKIDITGLVPIEFADHSKIEVGETAIAIGSPGGLEYMNSISEGIVSGINRDITTSEGVSFSLIQTTAAINPGNSGGALLNSNGQLIGICVIKIASAEYEGMGFAINSDTIKRVVESIREYGTVKHPKLGVQINLQYDSSVAKANGYPEGACVAEVMPGSVSEAAGMKANDIIVEFDGKVIKSYNDLKKEINAHSIGDKVIVKVFRVNTDTKKSETIDLEVTLGE